MEKKRKITMMIFMERLIKIIYLAVKMIKAKKKIIILMLMVKKEKITMMTFMMRLIETIYLVVKMITAKKKDIIQM